MRVGVYVLVRKGAFARYARPCTRTHTTQYDIPLENEQRHDDLVEVVKVVADRLEDLVGPVDAEVAVVVVRVLQPLLHCVFLRGNGLVILCSWARLWIVLTNGGHAQREFHADPQGSRANDRTWQRTITAESLSGRTRLDIHTGRQPKLALIPVYTYTRNAEPQRSCCVLSLMVRKTRTRICGAANT